jgi:hypothetical protein
MAEYPVGGSPVSIEGLVIMFTVGNPGATEIKSCAVPATANVASTGYAFVRSLIDSLVEGSCSQAM